MRLLTNFLNSPEFIELGGGAQVEVIREGSWRKFRALLSSIDLIVLDCQDSLIYMLAAYFLVAPWKKRPIVAVDMVLRKPLRWNYRLTAPVKRFLLSRVDHFIHYFKDISGYSKYFGIRQERSSYVPFKVNAWDGGSAETSGTEDYIFTTGVSLRDYDTFIRAVGELPYPAAIPEFSLLHFEGRDKHFVWHSGNLPRNLRVLTDSGSREDFLNHMRKARVVVIPILGVSLCASGISTYLDAMYMGKCVITTRGPGASDLLSDQAILIPPHDVLALREAIRRAWEDDDLRQRTAESGRKYALSLGGEAHMLHRIFELSVKALPGIRGGG